MFEKDLVDFFDSIEPSPELIERTINMSKENRDKRVKLSRKVIAVLVAAVILAVGITGYAGIARIFGDSKGIVSEETSNGGLVFDFSKNSRTPNKYSDKNEELVKKLNELKFDNVLLPTAIFDDTFEIYNVLNPYIVDNSCSIQMRNDKLDAELCVVGGLTPERMDGFLGTGDERTICNVTNINGVDVCICIEGDEQFGYYPYIFYAVDDTLYWIHFCAGTDYDEAVKTADEFAATLEQ